jgi:two-component system LytT family sensor kinase
VIVSAQRNGNRLDIRVVDDGVGLPKGWTLENSGGVGLSVTRQRVAGLYPDRETCFAVSRRASGGTEVEISLPLRWTGKDAHAAIGA